MWLWGDDMHWQAKIYSYCPICMRFSYFVPRSDAISKALQDFICDGLRVFLDFVVESVIPFPPYCVNSRDKRSTQNLSLEL